MIQNKLEQAISKETAGVDAGLEKLNNISMTWKFSRRVRKLTLN